MARQTLKALKRSLTDKRAESSITVSDPTTGQTILHFHNYQYRGMIELLQTITCVLDNNNQLDEYWNGKITVYIYQSALRCAKTTTTLKYYPQWHK